MTFLFLEVLLSAILLFVAPLFIPAHWRGAEFGFNIWRFNISGALVPIAVRAVGCLVLVFAVLSTSYVTVGDHKYAQMFRRYGGGALDHGKIIAVNGENGPQGRVLRPGFHFEPLLNILYDVNVDHTETVIPAGKVGVLTANDGAPLRPGQAFADPFPADQGLAMLDPETFFANKGQRGPQLTVLAPGTYVINNYLWKVEEQDAKDVATGFVGVVKSNVWASVDFGTLRSTKPEKCDVIGNADKSEGRLEAPIVPVGCVGVWKDSLQPGVYYMNPNAFTITPIDTRAQVWTYAGGYDRCNISLEVDSKGELKQDRKCTPVPVDKNDADRAIIVKMEGWDVPLELRAIAQVSPAEASCVVAGVGSLKEVEDRVLTPSIRAITRDVAGGTYDITEPKLDAEQKPILVDNKPVMQMVKRPTKVTDLINQRPLIEGEIERRIRPEAQKSCVTIREVRLGEPAIPPELLVAVRREQLATQLSKAYVQEQTAQTQRIASEKAKATANNQESLVQSEIRVAASVQNAQAAKNDGQGERQKLEQIAAGQKAQMEVLGSSATVQLRQFELTMKTVFDFFDKHPDVLIAGLNNASKFVPGTVVSGGTGGMLDGLLGKFLSSADSSGPVQIPNRPLTTAAPVAAQR